MAKEAETYKIFTVKLARELCNRGFRMSGTVPNYEKPWLNVYLFEDSLELRNAVEHYREVLRSDGRTE